MSDVRHIPVFGKRREPHTLIIARGGEIRYFTVRPVMAVLIGSVLAAFAVGYLLATSYLVLRDDLIGAAAARQARMQHAYEDRISSLRGQVDRITSRQLLDQQLVESKLDELMARQSELALRQERMSTLPDRTRELPTAGPLPEARPELRARLGPAAPDAGRMDASASPVRGAAHAFWEGPRPQAASVADRADHAFRLLTKSLRTIENEQIEDIGALTENAFQTAGAIAETLEAAGLPVDTPVVEDDTAAGGPLLPVDEMDFEARVRELDHALSWLERVRSTARAMPLRNPAPGQPLSSGFGVRRDPFLRTPAMHAGLDFRARTGTPVHAAGAGTVVTAGWNGGYGRMVEIDHGHGFTTRYAHMSRIDVRSGQEVAAGDRLGAVGSTGRSTGPHLHYEVRRNGRALNPMRFLTAGRSIGEFL